LQKTKMQMLLASSTQTYDVPAHENLQQDETAALVGFPVLPVAVLYSSSNAVVPGWEGGHRSVGVLASVLQRLQQVQAQTSTLGLWLGRPRLCNLAAQVLLYALGDDLRTTRSTRFSAAGGANAKIQQVSQQTGVAAQDIVIQADAVITRRNSHEYFGDLAALEEEVAACVEFMNATPQLREACHWEAWVLSNFAVFKAARPIVS
jgi:hypothetical protein